MYKILIVEDDPIIASAVAKHLASWGLQTQDFQHVTSEFAAFDPQLVLMDLSLPFYNGFHWCEEIRRISKVPIIFISS
ncbi:MAG: response regulator, partial [Oscillospiraceae bacterium]|nr:response regulator [Oscillospiraceae bacterium]